jgi:hypothetical protein
MAFDKSPTRNSTIVALGATAIVSLVTVKLALDSYFIKITESTVEEKLVSPEQLIHQHELEKKALASGPMPIDQALAELTRKGRDGLRAEGVDLSPKQSDDTGALTGWSKMPRALPVKPEAEVVPASQAALPHPGTGPTDQPQTPAPPAAPGHDAPHH